MWCRNVSSISIAHVTPSRFLDLDKPGASAHKGRNSWTCLFWQHLDSAALLNLRCPPLAPAVDETVLVSPDEV